METSMYKQYKELKDMRPDALLLFRVGDNYEAYGDDAEEVATLLSVPLSFKDDNMEDDGRMLRCASFPYYSIDENLPILVRASKRVAICDQLEDPHTKKLVKRGSKDLIS